MQHIDFGVSNLTDFSFSFQEILGFDEEKRVVSRELVKVYISALHAKAVRELLDRQIAAYEQTFGELTDPKTPPDGPPTEPEQPA